jgi:hypothetical protein
MSNLPQIPATMSPIHAAMAQRVLDQIPRGRTADSISELVEGNWATLPQADNLAAYGRALVAALRTA